MFRTQPNEAYLGQPGVETILLAGLTWPIPQLTPRQQRTVLPAVIRLAKSFAKIQQSTTVRGDDPLKVVAGLPDFTTENLDDLVTVIVGGLQQAHSGLKRNEVEDTALSLVEQFSAYHVIARQTMLLERAKEGEAGESRVGETTTTSPTGTQSSPESPVLQDGAGTS